MPIPRRSLLAGTLGITTAALLPPTAKAATMLWADTSRGRPFSKDPSVIRFGGRYLLYDSVPPKTGETRWGQAVAYSDDLTSWHRIRDIGLGICAGDAIVLGGKVHLFYQTYGGGVRDSICHASSTDGIHFTINTTPIFRPTGSWNCGRAIDAHARVVGDELFVYWATRDPLMQVQMLGVHSAPKDSDFSAKYWRQRCSGPILKPQFGWERKCIEAPTIQKRGDTYVMFYAGGYNNDPQQIGVAYSTDGLSWRRMSDQPFLRNGPPGSWNSSESGHPGIFHDPISGKTHLFHQGNNDDRTLALSAKTYYISRRRIIWDGATPLLA